MNPEELKYQELDKKYSQCVFVSLDSGISFINVGNINMTAEFNQLTATLNQTFEKLKSSHKVPGIKLIYEAEEEDKKEFAQCISKVRDFYKREILDLYPIKDETRVTTTKPFSTHQGTRLKYSINKFLTLKDEETNI
jgi:hypothetical protein